MKISVDIQPMIDLIKIEIEMLSKALTRVEKRIDAYYDRGKLPSIKLSKRWDELMIQRTKSMAELTKPQKEGDREK